MDFSSRLRMDNLYPTMPQTANDNPDYSLFNMFKSNIADPINNQRGRLADIGNRALLPGMQHPMNTNKMVGDGRPGNVSPNVVMGNQGAGPQIAKQMLGEEDNPATQYQKGELALRQKQLEQVGAKNASTDETNREKLAISQQRANVYDFKSKNPSAKIIAPKGGEIQAINPVTGKVIANFGSTGTMSEEDRMNLDESNKESAIAAKGEETRKTQSEGQKGKETLADMAARHAQELSELNASLKPNETNKVEEVKDASGKVVGARTTKTSTSNTNTVQMKGPDGKVYNVPKNKVDDATKNHMVVIK